MSPSYSPPNPVPPTKSRLLVKRDGHSITSRVPRPIILVDSREQLPFDFSLFPNWIAGEQTATLPCADYSILGMESLVALERKSLSDLVGSLMTGRERFLRMCERMTTYKYRAIIVESSYSSVKSPYHEYTQCHPNGISGSLDAIEIRYQIPIIYADKDRSLAAEKAASWLSKIFTYEWLESAGLGRVLQTGDL